MPHLPLSCDCINLPSPKCRKDHGVVNADNIMVCAVRELPPDSHGIITNTSRIKLKLNTLPIFLVAPLSDRGKRCTWEVMMDISHNPHTQIEFLLLCSPTSLDTHCRIALHMHNITKQNIYSRAAHT